MAFLKLVGVKAIVQDIGKFMKDMDRMNAATKKAVKRIEDSIKKEVNIRERLGASARREIGVRRSLEASARREINTRRALMSSVRQAALAIDIEANKREKLRIAIKETGAALDKLKGKRVRDLDAIEKTEVKLEGLQLAKKKTGMQTDVLADKIDSAGRAMEESKRKMDTLGDQMMESRRSTDLLGDSMLESEERTNALGDEMVELVAAASKTKIPLKEIAIVMAAIGAAVGVAIIAIKLLIKVIKKIATIILAPFKKVFEILKNITAAVTRFVVDLGRRAISSALNALSDAIRNAARAAVEGAVAFQKLSIRFQGLIAQEVIATGHVNDFSAAMKFATGPAESLLRWMQKLALATPFTRRDITETVAFSTAMGFTTKQAKQLVLSIGHFVAGMGLSTEVMERVILQFGQMQAGGKLFGTELRDLARGAFVPVNTIIRRVAENLGMTAAAWQDLAARGKTDIQPFFDEFITLVGERFPDAMDRMNKTMEAVIQNAGEFVREFLGVKLLLPAVEKLSERAANALEAVVSDEVLVAFGLAGKRVGGLVDRIIDLVGAVTKAVLGTSDFRQMAITLAAFLAVVAEKASRLVEIIDDKLIGFAEGIGDSAKDAFQWGVDLIVEFSRGIIVSTSGVLVQAMQFVGGMLSKWLKGASPPLVAPDLPLWGAAALTEWLKGMTLADFSVLEGLQAPLKRALGALEAAGEIAEEDIAPAFAAISTGLIEALAGGEVGQNVFDIISEHLGEFSDELNELIREELELQHAIRAVEQAERNLDAARRGFADQSLEVRKLTAEYNELLRVGSSPEILRAKLAEINAAENAREAAREQVRASEDALEAAEDRVDPLQDQVRLQEAILRQLIAMTEAQFDMDDVTDSVEDAERSIQDLVAEMGSVGAEMDEVADAFREARGEIITAWAEMFSGLRDAWDGDIADALGDLRTQFETFKINVINPFLEAFGLREQDIEVRFLTRTERVAAEAGVDFTLLGLRQGVIRVFDDIREAIENILTDIKEAVDIQIEVLLDPILPNFVTLIENSVEALDTLTEMLDLKGKTKMTPLAQALLIVNGLLNALIRGLGEFALVFTEVFEKGGTLDKVINGEMPGWLAAARTIWDLTFGIMGEAIEGLKEVSLEVFEDLIDSAKATQKSLSDDLAPMLKGSRLPTGGTDTESSVGGTTTISSIVSAPPVANQIAVNFFDTNINDQMDAATFAAMVRQAVAGAI